MSNSDLLKNLNENDSPGTHEEQLSRLQLEEQGLKVDELKLRVADLKKPAYKKLSFWTTAFTIVIALGGLLGQNLISNFKLEEIKADMKEAGLKKDSAIKSVAALSRLQDSIGDLLQAQQQDLQVTNDKVVNAQKNLDSILGRLKTLAPSKETESIKTLINKTQTQLNEIAPRVYIQIANENQRNIAKALQADLISNDFLVPGIENVAKLHAGIPSKTEVRYYRDEEKDEAINIIKVLQRLHIGDPINEIPQKITGNGRGTRPRHYEVWFTNF